MSVGSDSEPEACPGGRRGTIQVVPVPANGYNMRMPVPRRRSLAGRLLINYALAVLVVLVLLGLFVERTARESLLDTVEESLTQQTLAVAETVPDRVEAIPEFVEAVSAGIAARVTVIDGSGVVVADSHGDVETMENHSLRPEVQAAYRGETGVDRRVSESTGFPQLYVAVPVDGNTVLRLSLPESTVNAPVTAFRDRLLVIVGVVAVLGVAAVALVGRRLARPLGELSGVASEVADGNLDVSYPRSSITELDELGRSIGSVAQELGTRLRQVGDERRTLEVVLDAMPQGTLLVSAEDRLLYTNRSLVDMLGRMPDTLDQVVPFRIQETVRRARQTREAVEVDADHGRPTRIFRIMASPFEDGRVLAVVSDVTDRRRVDDIRRDFVTNASHELKTPVASILASAESLQVAVERAPDKVPQFAAQIENAARSLARLVADLLDLSRLEGRSGGNGDVDLGEVVRLEVGRIAEVAAQRELRMEVETSSVSVTGEEPDLSLAVRNLLDNAIRYTGPGGTVTVDVHRRGDEAVVAVSDTGVGIPQRDLERIFERFYRVDVARSRATGGTGLGLSIVRHVVENHGGAVTVDSQLGAGSTFTIRLPVA